MTPLASEAAGSDSFWEPLEETLGGCRVVLTDRIVGGSDDEEAVEPAEACEQTNGFGTCTGSWSCGGASGWSCDAPAAAAEICTPSLPGALPM